MSEGFLGPCFGCAPCGSGGFGPSGGCDLIVWLMVDHHPVTTVIGESTNYFAAAEGGSITLRAGRVPHTNTLRYHGNPAEYEAAEGHPPSIADGWYFYDTSRREFWTPVESVLTQVPAPAWHGAGEVVVNWQVNRQECGCPHMLAAPSGTFTWLDGDVTDREVTVDVTCPGPPTYWGCQGAGGGGEVGSASLALVSAEICGQNSGIHAHLVGLCTHTPPHPVWGEFPYYVRTWKAVTTPTLAYLPFDWDSATYPVNNYNQATYALTSPFAPNYEWEKGYFQEGNVLDYLRGRLGPEVYPTLGGPISGATQPDYYFIDYGGGETITRTLAAQSGEQPIPANAADALLDDAVANAADGNAGVWGWLGNQPTYVWKIRGNQSGFSGSPDFDPAKTYEHTGTALPPVNGSGYYDPDDWTEVADTGWAWLQEVSGSYAASFGFGAAHGFATAGVAGVARRVAPAGVQAWKSQIDARQSRNGNPIPQRVELRLKTYEDGIQVADSGWFDITDTAYDVAPPAGFGGAAAQKHITAEFRTTYVNADCVPTGPPIFVCHPGLACP